MLSGGKTEAGIISLSFNNDASSVYLNGRIVKQQLKESSLETKCLIGIILIIGTISIVYTSESNEVSLLRNFPFFVNMSRNMSVVD